LAAKKQKVQKSVARNPSDSEPKFPYTTKPASLRRLLKEIPKKPKPSKFDRDLLRSWGFGDTNDQTMLRVLKAVQLLNDRNEPTDVYSRFMSLDIGAKALGPEIKRVYAPLFEASLVPFQEGTEKLQNLFNKLQSGSHRIVYPYFSERPALSSEGARLGLWAIKEALPDFAIEDLRVVDVLRSAYFRPSENRIQGDERTIFIQRYDGILREWRKLKNEQE
jgi:hypothetical protein